MPAVNTLAPKITPKDLINYQSQDWKHIRDELETWLKAQQSLLEKDTQESDTIKIRSCIHTLRKILSFEESVAKKYQSQQQ